MRQFILTILFISTVEAIYAQQHITGKISDENGNPLSGAIISMLNSNDSSLQKTAIADKLGNYTIEKPELSTALIKIEQDGFITQLKSINEKDSVVNFVLIQTQALGEVIITDRKKLIEEKADRTVFNVEKSAVAFGGDALEAIKKMPGVQVVQQQIKVAGNSGVSIMVNGRLQHLSGDELIQFLRSVPANNISKIELITSPGAKYDAEGNAGIINLVTGKNIKDGLSGSISANYNRNSYGSPSGSLSLQYKTGKFNFYSNDNIGEWNWLYTDEASLFYTNQKWEQTVKNEYSNKNARGQIGVDYALKKNMTIGFIYTKGFAGNDSKEHISSSQFRNSVSSDSLIRSEGTMHEVYKGKHTANANYEWKIDTMGKKLSVSTDYFSQKLSRERNFDVKNFSRSEVSPNDETQNRIYENPAITIRSANADLDLPYSSLQILLGAKTSFVDNGRDFIYRRKITTDYKTDSSKSNRFLYKEQIHAGYASARKNIKNLEMDAGVRVEHTQTTGFTLGTQNIFKKDYTQLFPSANIKYKLNEHHNFVFSYTRRIERPSYNFLNPSRIYYTENSYQQGNPTLQPAIANNFRLSWLINAQYHIKLRVNQVNNYFDRIYFTDSSAGISIVSRANLGKAMFYVLDFSFSKNLAKWWELNGEASGVYNQFWLNAYGSENVYNGFSGWVELNNTFYLNKTKTLIAELNGYYYSPRQKDYKLWKEMQNINGGIKALLLDKTLTIGLAFDDPFAVSSWMQINKENGTREYSYDDERSVSLSVSYRFGNKNLRGKREKLETIEEIQRAK